MRVLRLIVSCLAVVSLGGCDLLNFTPLSISDWSPKGFVQPAGVQPSIWIEFSVPPDRSKAEQAFSLSTAGTKVTGSFSWSGNRLQFTPNLPLLTGPTYSIDEGTGAEDQQGNSLQVAFQSRFSIGGDITRPVVISMTPSSLATTGNPRCPLVITFSKAVDQQSAITAFSIVPAIECAFSWDSTGTVLTVAPQQDLTNSQTYTVRLETTLKDQDQNLLATAFVSQFEYIPTSVVAPTLVLVSDQANSVSFSPPPGSNYISIPGSSSTLQDQWSTDGNINLTFSEPINVASLASSLVLPTGLQYQLVTQPPNSLLSSSVLIQFTNPLPYQQTLGFEVKKGITDGNHNTSNLDYYFWICTNSPNTRPPIVTQVAWQSDKTTGSPIPLAAFQEMVLSPVANTTGLLEFTIVQGGSSSFNLASFMQNLAVQMSSGGLNLSKINVGTPTSLASNEKQFIVDIDVSYTSPTGTSIPVTITLGQPFSDNLANSMVSGFTLTVFAP